MKPYRKFAVAAILVCFALGGCDSSQTSTESTSPSPVTTKAPTLEPTDTNTLDSTETTTPTTAPTDTITSLYAQMGTLDDTYAYAVSYLGYFEKEEWQTASSKVTDAYQLSSIETADCDGCEAYAIYPKYDDTTISISKYTDADYTQLSNVSEVTSPVIVFCNPSDLRSNVEIIITHGKDSYTLAPFISLKDGSVVIPEEAKLISLE